MATRFYLPSSGTPAITPAFHTAVWDSTASAYRAPLVTSRLGTAQSGTTVADSVSVITQVLRAQFISAPLAATTLTGTFTAALRGVESSANANAQLYTVIRVVSGDGSTVRGVAFNGTNGSEYPTTTPASVVDAARTLTSTAITAGDRLVIEIGVNFNNTSGVAYTAGIYTGDNETTDYTTGAETAVRNGWIEFSQTLALAGGGGTTHLITASSSTMAGGWGGVANIRRIISGTSASGTSTTTGSAAATSAALLSASGSTQSGGSVGVSVASPITASGSSQSTGSAAIGRVFEFTASGSGSARTDGSVAIFVLAQVSASGATQSTGSAASTIISAITHDITASGSTQSTGAADVIAVGFAAASGLSQTDGSAAAELFAGISASGTSQSDGSVAIDLFYPPASLFATALVSGSLDDAGNALGPTDGLFTSDAGGSRTARFAMEDPGYPYVSGDQYIYLRVRTLFPIGQTLDSVRLYEAGSLFATATLNVPVSSNTGQTFSALFDESVFTGVNLADVEVEIVSTGGIFSSVQIDSVNWQGTFVPEVGARTYLASGSGASQTVGSASVTWSTFISASGASTSTGDAAITRRVSFSASGTSQTTGSAATAERTYDITASGTGGTTGSARIRVTNPISASGTGVTTGSAAVRVVRPATSSGTGQTTGSAAITSTRRIVATSARQTTGSARITATRLASASSLSQSAGAAAIRALRQMSASGAGQTTGTASARSGLVRDVVVVAVLDGPLWQSLLDENPRTATLDDAAYEAGLEEINRMADLEPSNWRAT